MNNTKYCFYSNRTFNQISTFESFVFTFYLNERNFGANQAFGG